MIHLLPAGGPAVRGYRLFLDRFGGAENVFVLVDLPGASTTPDALADAADAVAEALAAAPEVAEASSGVSPEDERFLRESVLPRAVLLPGGAPPAVLAGRLTSSAVAERVERLREAAASPLGLAAAPWLVPDPLGLGGDLLAELGSRAGLPVDPLTGGFLARDGKAALVLVRPARADLDPAAGRALRHAIEEAVVRAREASGLPLSVGAVGGSLYAAHDEAAFRNDLLRTVGFATVLVGILVVLAFDGLAIPLAALLAMVAAQVWTAAVLGLAFGRVSAVGVGLGAILVGLGDDYVVHLAAEFRESVIRGVDRVAALAEAVRRTAPGIVSAALTTAAGFAVLALGRFRPVAELGAFVALGVLIVLLTTALVAVPALALGSRRWTPGGSRPVWRAFGGGLDRVVQLAVRRRGVVLGAALVATALAAAGALQLRVDTDLRRLRPADPEGTRIERRLATEFGLGLDTATVVVPGKTADDALAGASAVARVLRAKLPPPARVSSPSDLLPSRSEMQARLGALANLPWARAEEDLRAGMAGAGLDPAAFARALETLSALGAGREPASGALELPAWLQEGVHDGPEGAAVAVQVQLPRDAWPEGPPEVLRAAVARVSPAASWVSAAGLGAEIRSTALADLRRLGTLAGLAVTVAMLISFRGRLRPTLLAAVPVVLGSLWTFGLWGALGLPLDLFALGVLPVLLSMGVDDGLHVLHAARAEGLAEAVHRAGRGILLTNLTTSAGFGSLALSHVPGLRSGGLLLCAGNLLCLVATFLVLPAMSAAPAAPRRRWARPTAR
ncbi:MAG TPA: MMPL family transporter [Candidatus Polarisedimenticolaceae bacterium]|nr:MMPL family transporter [Candidatus Polarisedimenticolaceae bacterium]